MANPQIENGHVKLASEIVDQLCKLNLSAYEWRILFALWRKTYGWHKKTDRISYTQFEELTGLDRRHIARTINSLKRRNIIKVSGNMKHNLEYSFQKDYDRWEQLPKGVATHKTLPIGATIIAERGNETLPEGATIVTNRGNKALPIGATIIAERGNKRQTLPIGGRALPIGATETLPKGVTTIANSILQKQYKGFSTLLKTVKSSKNKVHALAAIFVVCHQEAPPEDLENLGVRFAVLLKKARGDYGYLAKVIWDASSAGIAGSHVNYIAAVLLKKKPGAAAAGELSKDPDKFVKGKLGKLVKR